jgi:hypothetical protein
MPRPGFLPGYRGALRALDPEGTFATAPPAERGERVSPREGEGRRPGWRSAAQRALHGGRATMGQRAEARSHSLFVRRVRLAFVS